LARRAFESRFYPAAARVPFQDFGIDPACSMPKIGLPLAAWLKALWLEGDQHGIDTSGMLLGDGTPCRSSHHRIAETGH
jgi:hypothetical protein